MDDLPVWGLGEGLTTPHFKTLIFYEKDHRICYTVQIMHYSHFKTHSLQHLKPIKC